MLRQISNFITNYWTNNNKKIDDLIQEMKFKINSQDDIVFKWIPYNQFDNIEEISKGDDAIVYSALWNGPSLYYDYTKRKYMINSYKKVALKCLHNSQNITNEFLNEVKAYSIDPDLTFKIKIHGISQNPDTKDYIMVLQNIYHSGNLKVDNLIQEMKLKINSQDDIVFEWIPYNQFDNIEEISKGDDAIVYSATWKDGPLHYYENTRKSNNKRVILKCLHNSQNITNEFLNEVRTYSVNANDYIIKIYGISQNPDTKDYIIVLQGVYCSGNIIIDKLIREMHLKINSKNDIIFEWIPYNQFDNIEEMSKGDFATIYSATWRDGQLKFNSNSKEFTRKPAKKVTLKCLHNSQNITNDEFLNEVKEYSIDTNNSNFKIRIYGISQNPDTKDYIMVLQNIYHSGNLKVDNLIQEMQLKISSHNDIIFEWIPYNQFDNIEEISKGDFATIYSATWKNGPLYYYDYYYKYIMRKSNKKVSLKFLHQKSQNITNEFLNEVRAYSVNANDCTIKIYGISQNPDTKDYIMILQDVYYSGIKKIDNIIHEMQLKISSHDNVVFEWIPYNQFDNIVIIGEGGFATVYSAIWKNGPLYYIDIYTEYIRKPDKKVALKCLHNSQNITNEFLNEVKAYSINFNASNRILKIYGLSQNPDTKDFIMVLEYADGGNFNSWMNKNYKIFKWSMKLNALYYISKGLKTIHQNQMVHRDFHTGNILDMGLFNFIDLYISDMGLCGEVDNVDATRIYGVMPYVAPEVLRGKIYTQAADIYSFGMIMYFVATGRQPFDNCAHNEYLVINICSGIRPEINEPEAPKCYIDLMKKCWNSNPNNRPNAIEIENLIATFRNDLEKFKAAEEYRKANLSSTKSSQLTTHPQAIYTSRLLNPYTKDLPKDDNINNSSVEVIDFTML